MKPDLPEPVAEYFTAANTDNAERIAACFAPDARVHDEKRDFRGRTAIQQWAVDSRKKYTFQSEPFAVAGDHDAPVVSAHVTGDFPGSPVDLTYRFTLSSGAISSLSIG
jgi:ketosteroid isomerase-like protein